ncbi:hypothetical protein [Altibacter sp.]|uniref:hypothetical protein n=1 Tax=Altibacter sp. TaxID=2024823 RepID=UPI000C94D1F5|nr:hypothetical protein [Altibacter sp.]MAP55549.1 hypothetical protein [Altibacter sp.]
MKKFLLFCFICVSISCQDFGKLKILASLPLALDEVSGIEYLPDSELVWMVADAGNARAVFGVDPATEAVKRTIKIENAKNHDWEDLAADEKGTLYIGDFGNNNNARQNLAIYTVPNVVAIQDDRTTATRTAFSLEDQTEFPPKKSERNFDIEAFIYFNAHFYLFTRNRSASFDGTTKLYKLPAQAGTFEAKLISSFQTCKDPSDCDVTGAAIDHKNGTIALLTYNKVFIFKDYPEDRFFEGTVEKIKIGHKSQKESVSFKDANTLYIADERNGYEGGNLYELSLKN